MSKSQRVITLCLWAALLLTMVGVVAAKFVVPRLSRAEPPPVLYAAEPYALVDQNNAPFLSGSLRGRPYVASFMFTKCNGVCPRMNGVVRSLQADLPAAVHFVSFTVDPANDDAKTLKAYAATMGADESRWHFLTGELKQLEAAALGMKAPNKDWPAAHWDRLVLVDADGNIRGYYHCREEAEIKKLTEDAKLLAKAVTAAATPAGGAGTTSTPAGGGLRS
jgi:protein SCO1/2